MSSPVLAAVVLAAFVICKFQSCLLSSQYLPVLPRLLFLFILFVVVVIVDDISATAKLSGSSLVSNTNFCLLHSFHSLSFFPPFLVEFLILFTCHN